MFGTGCYDAFVTSLCSGQCFWVRHGAQSLAARRGAHQACACHAISWHVPGCVVHCMPCAFLPARHCGTTTMCQCIVVGRPHRKWLMRGQFEPDLSMGTLESIPGFVQRFCVSSPVLAHSTTVHLDGVVVWCLWVSQPTALCYIPYGRVHASCLFGVYCRQSNWQPWRFIKHVTCSIQ